MEKDIIKSDFLIRMYLGKYLGEKEIKEYIDNQVILKKQLFFLLIENYEQWKENLSMTQQLSLDIGIAQYQAEIEVLEKQKNRNKKETN